MKQYTFSKTVITSEGRFKKGVTYSEEKLTALGHDIENLLAQKAIAPAFQNETKAASAEATEETEETKATKKSKK